MIKKLSYIRAGWLPTRQANGIQTVRMCEAFAQLGVHVTLYYIPSPVIKKDVFHYYDVKTSFVLKRLPRAVLPMKKNFLWENWYKFPNYAHAMLWSGLAAYIASRDGADFYFTREPMVAWWLGLSGLPTGLEIHNSPSSSMEYFLFRKASECEGVKVIVTTTKHLREDLIKPTYTIRGKNIMVFHHGVDIELFNIPISKEQARHCLKLPLDKKIVVYSGQLSLEKGIDTLVEAASILKDTPFLLVGGLEEDINRYQYIAKEIGASNLIFSRYVPPADVPIYLKAADVLVIPQSFRLTWATCRTSTRSPLKLFEYMASERAILATRVPYIEEVVEHGKNAWLVEPDNAFALAEGLQLLLGDKDLCDRLSSKALCHVKKFSWRDRAAAILKEFEKSL